MNASDHDAEHQSEEQRTAEHDRPLCCCHCGQDYNYEHGWRSCDDGPACEACVAEYDAAFARCEAWWLAQDAAAV